MLVVLRSGDGATTIAIPTAAAGALTISRQLVGGPFASRKHCTVSVPADGSAAALLTDLGSTNGTFVNSTRVMDCALQLGDTEVFGFGKAAVGAPLRGNPPAAQTFYVEHKQETAAPAADPAATAAASCPLALRPLAGPVCWVRRPRITIGRGERADHTITGGDAFMQTSRVHCALTYSAGELLIEDLGSVNGTRVDGERMPARQPQQLALGARVTLGLSGSAELSFVVESTASALAAEAAAASSGASVGPRMLDDGGGSAPSLGRQVSLPTNSRLRPSALAQETQASQVDEDEEDEEASEKDSGPFSEDLFPASGQEQPQEAEGGQELEEVDLMESDSCGAAASTAGAAVPLPIEQQQQRKRPREDSPTSDSSSAASVGAAQPKVPRDQTSGSVSARAGAASASAAWSTASAGAEEQESPEPQQEKKERRTAAQGSGAAAAVLVPPPIQLQVLGPEAAATTALATGVLRCLVQHSGGSSRHPDAEGVRAIAGLEGTCNSLRLSVVSGAQWMNAFIQRFGGPDKAKAKALSLELLGHASLSLAKASLIWKQRYAAALLWMPCPYTAHGSTRWVNHAESQSRPSSINPWVECSDKRIHWIPPEQQQQNAQAVLSKSVHRYRSSGIVRHSGVADEQTVDGCVIGLPGGTEWLPSKEVRAGNQLIHLPS